VVFHDAYYYFEARYGLNAAGSVTVSAERAPGARRLSEIRAKVRSLGATCVFAEPQFRPTLVSVVLEGSGARLGLLDPVGAQRAPGPELYFELLQGLADSLVGCLLQP
jgi:zinc transport system substrate-binding protein